MERNFISFDLRKKKFFEEDRLNGTQIIEQRELSLPIDIEQEVFRRIEEGSLDIALEKIEDIQDRNDDEICLDLENTRSDMETYAGDSHE